MADLQLVTPDDYAVRFQVPHKMYLNFKEYYERLDHAGDTKPVLVAFEEVITLGVVVSLGEVIAIGAFIVL